jgi:hypothetical protein
MDCRRINELEFRCLRDSWSVAAQCCGIGGIAPLFCGAHRRHAPVTMSPWCSGVSIGA